MAWFTAEQALAALGVRPQTLYANVSRKRIRSKPDPKDSRRSLYHSEDIKRLATRRPGRRPVATVASEAISWGDPVLASSISTVAEGRLWYRGRDAITLSRTATLEEAAAILWEIEEVRFQYPTNSGDSTTLKSAPLQAALLFLSRSVAADPPLLGRSRVSLTAEATQLLDRMFCAMTGASAEPSKPLHIRMATAWHARRAQDILRRATVLLADHELNASTFAARVSASTGAPLSACLMAGLSTLTGPLHGGASAAARALVDTARQVGAKEAVLSWLSHGRPIPAFGHPLYADGDPRALALLAQFEPRPVFAELRSATESMLGEQPNVDFALAALVDAFDLPAEASFTIFAVARSVGWIAHVLEQSASGHLIRPRARYIGPPLASED